MKNHNSQSNTIVGYQLMTTGILSAGMTAELV
jgi:hypothetical protein